MKKLILIIVSCFIGIASTYASYERTPKAPGFFIPSGQIKKTTGTTSSPKRIIRKTSQPQKTIKQYTPQTKKNVVANKKTQVQKPIQTAKTIKPQNPQPVMTNIITTQTFASPQYNNQIFLDDYDELKFYYEEDLKKIASGMNYDNPKLKKIINTFKDKDYTITIK